MLGSIRNHDFPPKNLGFNVGFIGGFFKQRLSVSHRTSKSTVIYRYFWDGPEPFYEKTMTDRIILIPFLAGPPYISYSNLVLVLL